MSTFDATLILNGYVDGELDAAGMLDMERRLAAEPALRAELAALQALRGAIGAQLGIERASDEFRAKVTALAGPHVEPRRVARPTATWTANWGAAPAKPRRRRSSPARPTTAVGVGRKADSIREDSTSLAKDSGEAAAANGPPRLKRP